MEDLNFHPELKTIELDATKKMLSKFNVAGVIE